MALIPPDVGLRMRLQADASLLQPVAPAHEIPADLPDLRPGQTFSARIQEVLPDNSYKALVAGKQLTLQLPDGAKAGDLLELVVIDRSPKVVIAKQVEAGNVAGDGSAPYEFAKFSPAARMIGSLLPAEGEAAQPAQLNRGQPILPQLPQSQAAAAQLASALQKAVTQSGVFYEAHQAQWVDGQMSLDQLLREPQGQRSAPVAFQHAIAEIASRDSEPGVAHARPLQTAAAGVSVTEKVGAGETAEPSIAKAGSNTVLAGNAAAPVADEVRPLVQQQLEALATQRMSWHGEIWPRQGLEIEIDWHNERDADGSEQEGLRWNTSLSLTTPRLGRVDARLQLTAEGVHVTLATPYGASAADLRDESPRLADALAEAKVPLLSFHVRHEDEYATGT